MARDGAGTYNLPAGQPAVTGTTISSSTHNTLATDLGTALTNSLVKDGQTTPTANIPMGGFRLTGLGAATALTDAIQATQVQNNAASLLASVAGTNTITASATPTPSAYASGQKFILVPAATNTGATTINVSSLGAKNIFLNGAALVAGELQLGVPAEIEYDGTQFNVLANSSYSSGIPGKQGSDVASAATVNLDTTTGDVVDITGTTTITAITLSQGRKRVIRFTGALTFTHGASLVLPGATNITTAAGDYAVVAGYAAGVVRCVAYTRAIATPHGKYPTRQIFTSGSGTYTTAAGATRLRVRMVGGGGGGGGGPATNGVAGGDTTFSTFTASGGALGAGGGAGGAGGAAAGGTINIPGSDGMGSGASANAAVLPAGGQGGCGAFGGAGGGGQANTNGLAASTNSGSGGGGGGGGAAENSASGGGSGGYVEAFIDGPSATYSYGVGAGGAGGIGATTTGGAGAAGIIIVEEFYG